MAERTKRGIRDQDGQGRKCLRKIRPLLSRLRKVGTERDRAGNRRLFMDQYCALILMALFGPAIQSLRDLQRACTLDKVAQATWCQPPSPGSPSESEVIFDAAPLKEIVAELSWAPKAKHLSAYRLHTHVEVLSGRAVRIDATPRRTAATSLIAAPSVPGCGMRSTPRGAVTSAGRPTGTQPRGVHQNTKGVCGGEATA